MNEEKHFELCVVRYCDDLKMSVEIIDSNIVIDNDDVDKDDKIVKTLKKYMASIDCGKNPHIEIFCNYIFGDQKVGDQKVYVYTRNRDKTLSGLMSIIYLITYRISISYRESPEELLLWINDFIIASSDKSLIKLAPS